MYMYTHMLHGHLGAYLEFHHEHMANHVVARLRLTHPRCARVQWARTGGEGRAPAV